MNWTSVYETQQDD